RAAAGDAEAVHDRQRHPVAVPLAAELPDRSRALVRPHGCDSRARRRVLEARRNRAAHGCRRRAMIGKLRHRVLDAYAFLALAYLFLPIAIVVAFSFNYTWQGFTLKNWEHPLAYPGLSSALQVSLEIAVLSSLIATALGTLIALALVRYRFRGSATTNLLIFVPMATPEIVMGASLLALFVNWRFPLGFGTILIAHIMFNISYVVVTVRARLVGFDRH